jgi:UDP-glucose 4-epimerase
VTLVPRLPSVRVIDLARAVVGERSIGIRVTGIRPGEKVHEILISEEERPRTKILGNDYAIESILPEIEIASGPGSADVSFDSEYSSADSPVDAATARRILESAGVLKPAFAVA